MNVAIISCSPFIDYVRARTLRKGLVDCGVDLTIIKNEKTGFSRYFEVIFKLIKLRFTSKPDAYLITFRGYEILPFVLMIAGKTPVIFDEFINPIEWLIYEHHELAPNSTASKIFISFYRHYVRKCNYILADTNRHAEYSSALNNLAIEKYVSIPVGTDQELFNDNYKSKVKKNKKFQIFFYGQLMTPLHGLAYILEAAIKLKDLKQIEFYIIGGDDQTLSDINKAKKLGANIKYAKWVDFDKLPNIIHNADLCLGGPFGATIQSKLVVTGKTCQFLACQKPVLVGKTKIDKIFIDEKNCLVVDQGSGLSLAYKILWAYKNQKKLNMIAKNGKKTFDTNFSDKVISKKLQFILNKIST